MGFRARAAVSRNDYFACRIEQKSRKRGVPPPPGGPGPREGCARQGVPRAAPGGAAGVQGAAAPWRGCGGRAPARKNGIGIFFPSENFNEIILFAAHSDPAKIHCNRLHTPKDVGTTKQQARRAGAPPTPITGRWVIWYKTSAMSASAMLVNGDLHWGFYKSPTINSPPPPSLGRRHPAPEN